MLLFLTFPVDQWDVAFKLHAPRNATVEAACVAGKLVRFDVTPAARKKEIQVLNCQV